VINISIVEDNPRLLRELEMILNDTGEFQVIGAYDNGRDALKYLPDQVPHVLVMDLGLPDISGVDVLREVSGRFEEVEILVFTINDDKGHLFSALKAGASGYIVKGGSLAELKSAIRNIMEGGAPMSPMIARYMIDEFRDTPVTQEDNGFLTSREKEVLEAIAHGFSEKAIAHCLDLSPHTVHVHIKNTYKKLHAHSRTDALKKARDRGLL